MNKKRIIKAILPGLLFAVIATAKGTALLPEELYGNWLKTDGSNQFVIGLYPEVACYRSNTWSIISRGIGEGHWLLKLQNGSASLELDLLRKDAHTIVLSENGRQHTLKNTRTYSYQYKPEQYAFKQPFFTQSTATLKGYVHQAGSARKTSRNNYIQVSYKNPFTGEEEFFYAPLDEQRRFSISFPVYKFQRCSLSQDSYELADFFIQPGDTLLMAFNKSVSVKKQHPDYDMVMQKVCMMGDDADFNNLYQHFQWHRDVQSPANFQPQTIKGLTAAIVKDAQKAFYHNLYLQRVNEIQQLYTPTRAEQRFIDFLKDDARYECAEALLLNLKANYSESYYSDYKVDSSDMQYVYRTFLAGATTIAFLHDSYYEAAEEYGEKLEEIRYGNSRRYTISPEKTSSRIRQEYGPLLSKEFMQAYEAVSRDFAKVQNMSEEAIIRDYFHGSKEEAIAFKTVYGQITDQLFLEAADSVSYTLYKEQIADPNLRFAASLQRLLHTSSSDDLGIPSTFRIGLFKSYCSMPGTPLRLIDTLNMTQALRLAGASIQARADSSLMKEAHNEADWQNELKRYRGKVVVMWGFPSNFNKKRAQRSLYELKQMEELYKGRNVVFLKCIQQRDRKDKIKQLLGYIRMMENNDALSNIVYVNKSVSAWTLMSEAIEDRCTIYDTAGQIHHPGRYYASQRRWNENLALQPELDSVLAGKVREYESTADRIFAAGLRGNRYTTSRSPLNMWTLYRTAGPYLVLAAKEPEKPDYETGDSVFHQISFHDDDVYRESRFMLRKMPPRKDNNRVFYSYEYKKELLPDDFGGFYGYNGDKKLLSIFDPEKKLVKQYRMLTITTDFMVLELLK